MWAGTSRYTEKERLRQRAKTLHRCPEKTLEKIAAMASRGTKKIPTRSPVGRERFATERPSLELCVPEAQAVPRRTAAKSKVLAKTCIGITGLRSGREIIDEHKIHLHGHSFAKERAPASDSEQIFARRPSNAYTIQLW